MLMSSGSSIIVVGMKQDIPHRTSKSIPTVSLPSPYPELQVLQTLDLTAANQDFQLHGSFRKYSYRILTHTFVILGLPWDSFGPHCEKLPRSPPEISLPRAALASTPQSWLPCLRVLVWMGFEGVDFELNLYTHGFWDCDVSLR